MATAVIRYSERPELWKDTAAITREVWPEYNLHSEDPHGYWGRLFDEFAHLQFVLYDDQEQEVIAEGHTIPCDWDGTTEGLGDGIDAIMAAAFDAHKADRAPTALCALAAEIRPRFQGGGLASRMLDVMADLAREAGPGALDRAGPPDEPKGPLPDHPDRAVRDLDSGERRAVRSVDPDPYPARREDRQTNPTLDAHRRDDRGVGAMDPDALP